MDQVNFIPHSHFNKLVLGGRPSVTDQQRQSEAMECYKQVIFWIQEGWSPGPACARAGISWGRHNKWLMQIPEFKAAKEAYQKRRIKT